MSGTLGILLAGGQGTRLGLDVPKALGQVGGFSLLARGAATLAAVCDEVVATVPATMRLPREAMPSLQGGRPLVFASDPPDASGPLAGLVAGLNARPFARAVVLGVDFPFVSPGLLRALLRRLESHLAVVPAPDGVPQPLVAAYAGAAAGPLAASLAAGERSVSRAVGSLTGVVRLDDDTLARLPGGLASFFNLNTPADLAIAEARMTAERTAR